jgi:hypothetical protein
VPYPLFNDIASASTYMREDITEGKTGVPLQLLLTFINVNANCTPITDALVYAWHQLCTMSENAATGGYDAALTVGVAL